MANAPRSTRSGLLELQCFAANLRRAERAVHRLYSREIRQAGIEPTQFTLLAVLDKTPGASQGELSEWLTVDSTTLSRTLAPMIERKWIARQQGGDRRVRHYRLTPAGKRLLRTARVRWQRAQERLRQAVGPDEWPQMIETLLDITRAAEATPTRT